MLFVKGVRPENLHPPHFSSPPNKMRMNTAKPTTMRDPRMRIQLIVDRKILDPDSVSKLSISGLELELKLELKSEFSAGKQYHAEIFVLK